MKITVQASEAVDEHGDGSVDERGKSAMPDG